MGSHPAPHGGGVIGGQAVTQSRCARPWIKRVPTASAGTASARPQGSACTSSRQGTAAGPPSPQP